MLIKFVKWIAFLGVYVGLYFLFKYLFVSYTDWCLEIESKGWKMLSFGAMVPFIIGATTFPILIPMMFCKDNRIIAGRLMAIATFVIMVYLYVGPIMNVEFKKEHLFEIAFNIGILLKMPISYSYFFYLMIGRIAR